MSPMVSPTGVANRARMRPEAFVAELEALVRASAQGAAADLDALLACALWLLDQGEARVPELYAFAVRDGHALVAAMLAELEPHRGLRPRGRLAALSVPETARVTRYVLAKGDAKHPYRIDGVRYPAPPVAPPRADLSADERPPMRSADFLEHMERLLAELAAAPVRRRPLHPASVRRAVAQIARHQSAFTIGRLLDDPATRESDVIGIAARRPTTPAIVRAITSRPRWMMHPHVRVALVANPCTPTRVALVLFATCARKLPGIASLNVHPRVLALARELGAP